MRGDGSYGDSADMQSLQSGADMRGGSTPAASQSLIPFGAPTQSPGEPVTAGSPLGAGIGPQAAGILDDKQATLEQLAPLLPSLELAANLPGATAETRAFVRALKARLG